jgi:hypothetical protein
MFAFTDLYHDPKNEILFKATAFGGLNEKEIAELTKGESHWDLDQKSDKAWEIQSGAAKNIANEWLKEPKPYEKLIQELNTLSSTAQKNDPYDRREARLKIAAAEWLLLNNPVMMVQDPNDPLNPIPNWGNRYWKALTQTREALGIDKHTPIRTLIQEEYAEAARAAKSTTYHETQVKENVLSDDARAKLDSMEMQKVQFATQSAHVNLTEKQTEKDLNEIEVTGEKVKISIKILDQREIDRNSPKNYGDFKMEHTADVKIASNEKDDKMII